MALTLKDKLTRIEIGILAFYSNDDDYMSSIHDHAGDPIDLDMWAKMVGFEYRIDLDLINERLTISITLIP